LAKNEFHQITFEILMKNFLFLMIILACVLWGKEKENSKSHKSPVDYVNPFIGTGGHGHTFPGASVPFGMVQLSPDTHTEGWDWCSGYHASDSSIMGFSHTHLSGTGAADYGDILFMPTTGDIKFNAGSRENPDEGYRSRFSHNNEIAKPGYYSVFLDDYKIAAALTTSERCGFQKYIFPSQAQKNILIDLDHGIQDITRNSSIKIIDAQTIAGFRRSGGWADDHTVFFYAEFSKPFSQAILFDGAKQIKNENVLEGKIVKAALQFGGSNEETILVKVGISAASIEGAKKNLKKEIPLWNFDLVVRSAASRWEKELSKIEITSNSEENKTTFYTALYHAMLAPNIFSDVDGGYTGMDKKIHYAKNFTIYTVYSLWDTFRALHPLLSIIDRKRTNDFIQSMLAKYQESGLLPVWELASNETNCMIGYHAVPVITDAFMKGIKHYDVEKIYYAMKTSAMQDVRGLRYYKQMGFIPMDKEEESVSKTLEYAYDDWCIAQMAKSLKKNDDYRYFVNRAQNYKNVFDSATTFMRGRMYSGMWKQKFDPVEAFPGGAGEFTEGSSWQYTWFVPQDVSGLMKLMGGDQAFSGKLDHLFKAEAETKYFIPSDMSGLIGQYAHGNEPSHHVAYLYNFVGDAWKTQFRVRNIMETMYAASKDGLSGNEDCGQMSAWYVLSALGFYPVTPGSNVYAIGSPLFDKAVIKLENGKRFTVETKNNGKENSYISSAQLNGKIFKKSFLLQSQIANGGAVSFTMSNAPNKNWGTAKADRPVSEILDPAFVPVEKKWHFTPTIPGEAKNFSVKKEISFQCYTKGSQIHYTLDGTNPTEQSPLFTKPFFIEHSTEIKARAFNAELPPSEILTAEFTKAIARDTVNPFYVHEGIVYPTITLAHQPNRQYTGGSSYALIDGIRGSHNFHDGKWIGFQEDDLDATIDLGKSVSIASIHAGFMRSQGSWIFLPAEIIFAVSEDGKHFTNVYSEKINAAERNDDNQTLSFGGNVTASGRYIKIFAKNLNDLPSWHKGSGGGKAFIFIDEIMIEEN